MAAEQIQMPVELLSGFNNLNSVFLNNSTVSCMLNNSLPENDIPTIDYSMLVSSDPDQRAKSLKYLNKVCEEFGFFYLVNHGVPDAIIENALAKSYGYFYLTEEDEKKKYHVKTRMDRIRWGTQSHAGENREHLKVVSHPEFHCPVPSPDGFGEALYVYSQRARRVVLGLARAISLALGLEESYIEKVFKLRSGFDVVSLNMYPPNSQSKGSYGLPDHTDPGFVVTLIQDVNGGLEVLNHNGQWFSVNNMPKNAILIQLGDHLEIISNGKYKSHLHRVFVTNNEVSRMSIAILHGPSLDSMVVPKPEFVSESHPSLYRAQTYKESLEENNNGEIDMKSSIEQARLVTSK